MNSNSWTTWFSDHEQEHLQEFFEFLSIPSVSALPDHRGDVRRAATWVHTRLEKIGVPDVQTLETGGHPLIVGRWHVSDELPTGLIYAHYDVQPPDPLSLWESPPFEPEIRDGRIYARGAGDDKAGLLIAILSAEALVARNGAPPINLVFFFEGEEEIGSPNVSPFVSKNADMLACDFAISADGMMWGEDTPSLMMSTKGMAGCQVDLKTALTDMHSGAYGAGVKNAAQAIGELATSFHDAEGRVAVEGFYNEVLEPTPEERAEIAAVEFDQESHLGHVGVEQPWGEEGYSLLERLWMRPTLDINGIWSGFQGDGTKTVTPAEGHLKITCRLVPNQNPRQILELIGAHVEKHCPAGATCSIVPTAGSALPNSVSRDNPALKAARDTLTDLFEKDPAIVRTGGTIPIAEVFKTELGAELIFFAWSLETCNAHAPNEWFRLEDFRRGPAATCEYLQRLASI